MQVDASSTYFGPVPCPVLAFPPIPTLPPYTCQSIAVGSSRCFFTPTCDIKSGHFVCLKEGKLFVLLEPEPGIPIVDFDELYLNYLRFKSFSFVNCDSGSSSDASSLIPSISNDFCKYGDRNDLVYLLPKGLRCCRRFAYRSTLCCTEVDFLSCKRLRFVYLFVVCICREFIVKALQRECKLACFGRCNIQFVPVTKFKLISSLKERYFSSGPMVWSESFSSLLASPLFPLRRHAALTQLQSEQ